MSAFLELDTMHPDAMGWGVLSVIMLTALVSFASGSGITRCFWDCCHKLQVPFNEHVVERVTRVSNKISGVKAWLPDGYSQIVRSFVFGPSGFWTMAPLRYAAKFDPFLSLDCAPTPSTLAQYKERKGSNFAIWQP